MRDEDGYRAVFNDLGSAPVSMPAGKILDFYGMLPGNALETADAVRAYPQAPLMGTETWVRLPKDKRPAAWAKLRDPVCLLKRALYGHPDAGSCWEVFAEEKIRSVGFEPIPNWPV